MGLQSFGDDITAVIFGASGGIGSALAEQLRADPAVARLLTVSRGGSSDLQCNYHDEASIDEVARIIAADGPVHLVVVATGILHADGIKPEKTWKHLDADVMAQVFAINTIVPTMIAKHMLPILAKDRKSAFAAISARVGSISDNRLGGWLSYRASKAALNMSIKTLSVELSRTNKNALIVGLHPGTVETGLSKPFRSNLPEGQLFTPRESADKMIATLDRASQRDSGSLLSYDGMSIQP